MKTKRASQSHLFAPSVLLCTRSFPAVCGGDVCPVGAGVGCGGCLHRPPALYSVSKLPVVPQLRSVLYVCSCWHLLLPSGWPSFPPDRPNHPDSLQLTLTSSSLEGGLRCLEYKCSLFFSFLQPDLWYVHNLFALWNKTVWQLCGVNYLTGLNTLFQDQNMATIVELGNGIIIVPSWAIFRYITYSSVLSLDSTLHGESSTRLITYKY